MYISQQLKKKNIAEYLLYMWQVEDLIRANGCDMERIRKNIIEPYAATDEQKKELARWYEDLINMMQQEGVLEKGHVQINKNIIVWLTDLHLRLLLRLNSRITVRRITRCFLLLWNCVPRVATRTCLNWRLALMPVWGY